LAAKKMVVLQAPGLNKQFAENVEKLLAELPETTDLIIVEPKLDKRGVYYKFLKKQKGFQEFSELDERGLSKWLVDLAKEKGSTLSMGDAAYLISRIGTNQQALANELEKLSIYADKIDRVAIMELTAQTPQSMLAWQLHVLALIKTAKDKTPDEIARDARISPYVVRKTTSIARNLTLAETKRLVRDLLTIDERLKRESLNADDTLLNYLMTISE
jgi:DNA polymerase III delta subunit